MRLRLATLMLLAIPATALAAVTSTTQHGPDSTSLDGQISTNDLIAGLIATELPGDMGWHGANTLLADQLPAFTDGLGISPPGGSNLTGLLNDFPGAGNPAKRIQYDLPSGKTIGSIKVLTGNDGKDGRVFSTFAVSTSTNGGGTFIPFGYFESDPLGSVNAGQIGSTLVSVFDDASPILASGVTNLRFDLYAVDNTQGRYQDPFNGVNPFTGLDDMFGEAAASPLVFEIDVVAIPEPATATIVVCGLTLAFAAGRRRRLS
jgi:hypothetical protein